MTGFLTENSTTIFILAQTLGWIAFIGQTLSYQRTTGKHILSAQIPTALLWVGHYYLLSATTGALIAMMGLIRNLLSVSLKEHHVRFVSFGVILLTWVLAYFMIDSPYGYLATLGSTLIALSSLYQGNIRMFRNLHFSAQIFWLAYGIALMSWPTIGMSLSAILSNQIAVLRAHKQQPVPVPVKIK